MSLRSGCQIQMKHFIFIICQSLKNDRMYQKDHPASAGEPMGLELY